MKAQIYKKNNCYKYELTLKSALNTHSVNNKTKNKSKY